MPWHPEMQQLENRLNERIEHVSHNFRNRQIVIYVVVVILMVVVVCWLSWQDQQREENLAKFRKAVIVNCEANRQSDLNYNALIDTIIARVEDNKDMSATEKAQAKVLYNSAKAEVGTCPPK